MKKLIILLIFLAGCVTVPAPKVVMNHDSWTGNDAFVIEAESGYLECIVPMEQKERIYPFKGPVRISGTWITFTPDREGGIIREATIRLLCEVLVTHEPENTL